MFIEKKLSQLGIKRKCMNKFVCICICVYGMELRKE